MKKSLLVLMSCLLFFLCTNHKADLEYMHPFEIVEIELTTNQTYENPYTDVECWVELEGPGFKKKVYGFWDGGKVFKVRLVGTSPGAWSWKSYSNQTEDEVLNGKTGKFEVIEWSEEELDENPNRHGFLKNTSNNRALEYADGHPFFMKGDTWWAAPTWRYPLKGIKPKDDYVPAEGISLEEALHFRKKQGYNTIAMIAAYPNWTADEYPPSYMNEDSIGVRQSWEKNGTNTGQDMHDDEGNMPFDAWGEKPVIADYDKLNPVYFQSLDRKMKYITDQGFAVFLETVRRDHGPSWKHYFDWPNSFSRYVQYIIARYGAFNIIFSGIHLDWINENYSLTASEFNKALTYHYEKYGPLPFGQPYTILIDGSTYHQFGHANEAPWLTMHSVGNVPRNHGFYPMIEELYNLDPVYPNANLEPYYPGWDNVFHNTVAGERPEPGSDRDNYFGRTQMYGSVMSGGLTGYVFGTGAYDGNTTGEPKNIGDRPYIWEGLNYEAGAQLQYMGKFITSEGIRYLECIPSKENLLPCKAADAKEDGLDGWSFMLLAQEKDLAFLYFENAAEIPLVTGLEANGEYSMQWFDPLTGVWLEQSQISSNQNGEIQLNAFPDGQKVSTRDWALKFTSP